MIPGMGEGPKGPQYRAIAMTATSAGHHDHKGVSHDLLWGGKFQETQKGFQPGPEIYHGTWRWEPLVKNRKGYQLRKEAQELDRSPETRVIDDQKSQLYQILVG